MTPGPTACLIRSVRTACKYRKYSFLTGVKFYLIGGFVTGLSPRLERHIKIKVYRLPCPAPIARRTLAELKEPVRRLVPKDT